MGLYMIIAKQLRVYRVQYDRLSVDNDQTPILKLHVVGKRRAVSMAGSREILVK